MIKLLTVVGARPQIIKASAISRAIANHFKGQIEERIIHTGQHYDTNMSEVFFEEMGIPKPYVNLESGSSSHGLQTARIMEGMEKLILDEMADAVLIYGDTNSTIAAALAASKIHVPVIHVEAGLRSFNKAMPEEINRILSDHVSTLLFCPTHTAVNNLLREGFGLSTDLSANIDQPHVYHCGDIMYDNSLHFARVSDQQSTILRELGLLENQFALITIHRNNNTDDPQRLTDIFRALLQIQAETGLKMVLPLHPRTRKMIEQLPDQHIINELREHTNFCLIPPAGFIDIIALEKNARIIITDSGGLQKEAYFFKKPCVILRPETEWVEIVENGNALLADAKQENIVSACNHLLNKQDFSYPDFFGDGQAAVFIVKKIIEQIHAAVR